MQNKHSFCDVVPYKTYGILSSNSYVLSGLVGLENSIIIEVFQPVECYMLTIMSASSEQGSAIYVN